MPPRPSALPRTGHSRAARRPRASSARLREAPRRRLGPSPGGRTRALLDARRAVDGRDEARGDSPGTLGHAPVASRRRAVAAGVGRARADDGPRRARSRDRRQSLDEALRVREGHGRGPLREVRRRRRRSHRAARHGPAHGAHAARRSRFTPLRVDGLLPRGPNRLAPLGGRRAATAPSVLVAARANARRPSRPRPRALPLHDDDSPRVARRDPPSRRDLPPKGGRPCP